MLYETFNSIKESFGQDYFTSRVGDEIIQNLNPKFELQEYQKKALDRFDFYFNGYKQRKYPAQLSSIWRLGNLKLTALLFYNKTLEKEFEKALESKILS